MVYPSKIKFFTSQNTHSTALMTTKWEKNPYTDSMKWSASKIISLHSLVTLSLRFAILRRKKNPLKATTQLRFNTNYTITYTVYLIQNFPLMRRQRMPSYILKNFHEKGKSIILQSCMHEWYTDRHLHTYTCMQHTGSQTNLLTIFTEFYVQKGPLFSTDLVL